MAGRTREAVVKIGRHAQTGTCEAICVGREPHYRPIDQGRWSFRKEFRSWGSIHGEWSRSLYFCGARSALLASLVSLSDISPSLQHSYYSTFPDSTARGGAHI